MLLLPSRALLESAVAKGDGIMRQWIYPDDWPGNGGGEEEAKDPDGQRKRSPAKTGTGRT